MKLRSIFNLFLVVVGVSTQLSGYSDLEIAQGKQPLDDWTIFIYMEARNNLSPFAITNLNDMARIGSIPGRFNICVQWNQPQKNGSWRYKITQGKIELAQQLPHSQDGNCVREVSEGAAWAFGNHPAKHYAFVFWDHGVGAIDPVWGRSRNCIPDGDVAFANPHYLTNSEESDCRGILFDEVSKTYMNNQQMIDALGRIKRNVLHGKKIDLIGFDACLMGMVEIFYQIRDFAHIAVASEEVEHADGWNYTSFLTRLAAQYLSPTEFAASIVAGYHALYQKRKSGYTQAAIDLQHIDILRQNIDQMVMQLKLCAREYGPAIKALVHEARRACVHFNTASYVDLHSFYNELYQALSTASLKKNASGVFSREELINNLGNMEVCETILPDSFYQDHLMRLNQDTEQENPRILTLACNTSREKCKDLFDHEDQKVEYRKAARINFNPPVKQAKNDKVKPIVGAPVVEKLKEHLLDGMKIIESIVIMNATSNDLAKAKGISIYYPRYRIDRSYLKTEFAKDSLWLEFLKENG